MSEDVHIERATFNSPLFCPACRSPFRPADFKAAGDEIELSCFSCHRKYITLTIEPSIVYEESYLDC